LPKPGVRPFAAEDHRFTLRWDFASVKTVMKRRDFLGKWGLSGLKIKAGFLEGEFAPNDPDREAAWELYVELLTRVTTQSLLPESGDEKAALDSVYAIFPLTRYDDAARVAESSQSLQFQC